MLDPSIMSVAKNRVTHDFEDRRIAFKREIGQLWEGLNARGQLRSGATVKLTIDAIGTELRIRSSLIWYAFAHAIDAKRILLSYIIASAIKKSISDLIDEHSSDLSEHYKKLENLMKRISPPKTLSELKKAALDRTYNEINYAMLKTSEDKKESPKVVNIYQSYGIVQTGDSSSASLEINIGAEEYAETEKALNAVKQLFEQGNLVGKSKREEALDLVSDVENEIRRDKPNLSRIRGALQGIATTIQTVAAAQQAYQLIKGAASFFGLQLP